MFQVTEQTSLLNSPGSSYVHFMEVQDPSYLGTAMENATLLSKLIFHWVTPLMEKGVRGLLKHADDLYDLPDHITTASINYGIDKNMRKMVKINYFIDDICRLTVIHVDSFLASSEEECVGWVSSRKSRRCCCRVEQQHITPPASASLLWLAILRRGFVKICCRLHRFRGTYVA